jgi:hypothetical protein
MTQPDPTSPAGRRHLALDPRDNVTTLLDDARDVAMLDGGLPAAPGVPFGHKVALASIPRAAAVVKYGVTIGTASADIAEGEHVHVHNCR